jgi:beta-glucosidase
VVESRGKAIITVHGLRFRDLDGDGKLTPYEDWRLSPRCARPLRRMSVEEKVGQMLHGTLPASAGSWAVG